MAAVGDAIGRRLDVRRLARSDGIHVSFRVLPSMRNVEKDGEATEPLD